jgi:two-component system, cell cycle sensor histidine kinase and response regulator CckA
VVIPPASDSAEAEIVETLRQRVLVVDDNEIVRDVTVVMLERLGFEVHSCVEPWDALRLAEELAPPDFLVADVVMPAMSGLELADRLTEVWPDVNVVFTSGHANESVLDPGRSVAGAIFVPKPFTSSDLAAALRDAASSNQIASSLKQTGAFSLNV